MREALFLRRGTPVNAAGAAVVADAIHRRIGNRRVVYVVHIGDVHVADRAVIEELSALPASALKAFAKITEAVTDSAVEADVQSPVAFIEGIAVAAPAPIPRRPEKTWFGSHDPCPGTQ